MDIRRRAHTRIYFLLLVSLCVCLSENLVTSAVIRDGKGNLFRLSLIHYNDFHARFEETTNTFPVCSTNDSNCLGGFARLYQEIQLLLRERPDSIVLNAGDVFQGTYWYTLLKWNATQKFINLLPNDVHTIGNHEFDDGIAGLAPYLAGLNAPVVVANIDTSKEPSLEGLYSPHIILTRKGRKIGIIGLITNSTAMSSNVEKVVFLDPIETAKKEAKILTQKGVDMILVLSHCGLAVDKEIAREVGDNIDVIIGGHSHSLLWNGDAPETVSGPYPVIETAQNGHKVVIVTASAYSKFLGNLTLYFDDKGEMKYLEGEPIYLNRSIPEDPLIKAMLMPYLENLHNIVNDVVGYASIEMNDDNCGFGECVLGNFIADAFLNITKLTIQTDLPHVSFILRNMIRGAIPQGNITKGVVINTLPITNQVVTFPVKGMDLLKGFEFALKETWRKKPFAGPFVPHVAGIKLTLNTTSETVHSVYVSEGTNWIPLNPEQEYQLTTVKFLLKGGNKFEMFKKYEKQAKTLGVDHEIFEKYIKSKPTTPTLDNRLVLVV